MFSFISHGLLLFKPSNHIPNSVFAFGLKNFAAIKPIEVNMYFFPYLLIGKNRCVLGRLTETGGRLLSAR